MKIKRIKRVEFEESVNFNGKELKVTMGRIAPQANTSILLSYGDQQVFVAATMGQEKDVDFFPLTVDYEEKFYAIGKIPGSFFRREARPTERAILTSRIIDRSIRPLFPSHLRRDVHMVITPYITSQDENTSWLATLGASIALAASDIPFAGEMMPVHLGKLNGEFVLNPAFSQEDEQDMDLFVSFYKKNVVMIELDGKQSPEEDVLKGIDFAYEQSLILKGFVDKIVSKIGKEKTLVPDVENKEFVTGKALDDFKKNYTKIYKDDLKKAEFSAKVNILKNDILESLSLEEPNDIKEFMNSFNILEKKVVRENVLKHGLRRCSRKTDELREIDAQVSLIKGMHGSSLFQRGGTQVVSFLTLGSPGDKQKIDDLSPIGEKRFMHHYNFPPYSVGEAGWMRGPGRREIGHGALVEKAIAAVFPSEEKFPYTVRVVSECTSSNGSTSMGSTCAATLALLDGGVPLIEPVAGISIGLMSDEDGHVLLRDIEGIEDFYGEMDFKVAGTVNGITAIQVDVKGEGIKQEFIPDILEEARIVRNGLLDVIKEEAGGERKVSESAPKIFQKKIGKSDVSTLIGPGGKMIKSIQGDCDVKIDIDDEFDDHNALVVVTAPNAEAGEMAKQRIDLLFKTAKAGEIYEGKVTSIREFGLFVSLFGRTEGLLHISEVDKKGKSGRLNEKDLIALYKVGEEISVKVKEIRRDGKVSLILNK
ncbi:polyribonucleotide nucleotidyltransferase [bacterium]|nr:polyribonucleotide nucleotidyltransferase [bacterium]